MKSFITPSYTFDASAQTVDLTSISGFDMKRLVAIINQTDGVIIYSTASTTLGGSETAGVVTLDYDTTSMSDTDDLQIIYDTPDLGYLGVAPALTVKHATVTVGTTAVRATTDGSAPSSTRRKLRIFMDPDTTTGKLYLGSSSVAHAAGATRGEQIFPGVPVVFDNDANDYYIISDTASNLVSIVEVE